MATVAMTGLSSRTRAAPRWTPTGDRLQRGQSCWPPLGRTVGCRRAAAWPPLGRISHGRGQPRSRAALSGLDGGEGRDPRRAFFDRFNSTRKSIFASSAAGRRREPREGPETDFRVEAKPGSGGGPRRRPKSIFASSSEPRIRFFDRSRPPIPDFRVKFRPRPIFRSKPSTGKSGTAGNRPENGPKIIFASIRGRGVAQRRFISPEAAATRLVQRRRERPGTVRRTRAPPTRNCRRRALGGSGGRSSRRRGPPGRRRLSGGTDPIAAVA